MFRHEGQVTEIVSVTIGDSVMIGFSGSAILRISLRDDDYLGPEALQFGGGSGPLWVV